MRPRWLEHLAVLGAYTALALALTLPLALDFSRTIPGIPGDVWSYLWAMGWARASLLDLAVNPFHDDYIFYPLGGATQLLWGTTLPSFASLPLQLAFGLVPAFNLMYLASTILTAYGTYLLACHVQSSVILSDHATIRLSSFLAGLAFAFCALRQGYGLAFTNLYHTELIPFYILFVLKARERNSWRTPIAAGILLGLNAYIDFQITAFLALFSALWFAAALFQLRRAVRQVITACLSRAALVAAVAALVAAPMFYIVARDLALEGGNYVRVYPLKYSAARSYDVLAYFLPNARSSLYQLLPAPRIAGVNAALNAEGETQQSPDRQVFLGFTVLAFALYGVVRRPRALAFWIVATILFAFFSFGPVLHFAGNDFGIPLPYIALHEIPLVNSIRIPMRYGLMVFLGAAILAGAGMQALLARTRIPPLALGTIIGALILGESAALPQPLLTFDAPRVYATIAAQAGDFTVLEIPSFNWRAAAENEAYQTIHRKRILRAYTNRIAPQLADYFSLRQTPIVVRSLRALEGEEASSLPPGASAAFTAPDRALAPQVIRFYNLRYALLHRAWFEPEAVARLDRYLRQVLGARKFFDEGSVAWYEFPAPAPNPTGLALDAASDVALMYLGRGWQSEPLAEIADERGRYLAGAASELYFVADAARDHTLSARVHNDAPQTVLQFELNGRVVGAVDLQTGWSDYAVGLPAAALQNGMNRVRILHPPAEAETNRVAVGSIEIH